MKRIFLLVAAIALMSGAMAQADTLKSTDTKDVKPNKREQLKKEVAKELIEKPVIVRDRLNFDIFHSFWMGTPAEGNFKKFNPGFNVAAMWDFKMPQSKSFTFGLGLGFTLHTQYSNCLLKYDKATDISKYQIIPSNIEFKRSRLAYANVHIPFEVRYRHANGFKVSVGVHVGLVAGLSHKYKGPDYDGTEGANLNYKDRNFYNKQKFSADVYMRMGWKAFAVYYSYQLNKVFENDKGPRMNPMSVGLSISLF